MRSLLCSDSSSDRGSHSPFFIVRAFYLFLLLFRLFVTECIILEWRRYFYRRTAYISQGILKGENYPCGRFALKSAGGRDLEK